MNENENIEPTQDEVAGAQEAETPQAEQQEQPEGEYMEAPSLPEALKNVDPEKLAALREKLARFAKSDKKTMSGSEAPDAPPAAEEGQGPVNEGKDVDWSEYDLEYSVRHLYRAAQFRPTPQRPEGQWIAMVDEFHSATKNYGSHGQRTQKGKGEPMNVGEYLNDMLNSPEGWRVISMLPAGMGQVGVLLQRSVPVALPDPKPLKKETEVEAPKDGELQQVEDAAMAFAANEGLTPEAPVEDNGSDPQPEPAQETPEVQ